MYGTPAMAKSLTFVWALLGTKPYYGIDLESHGKILEELRGLANDGRVKSTLKQHVKRGDTREAHRLQEEGGHMGKIAYEW